MSFFARASVWLKSLAKLSPGEQRAEIKRILRSRIRRSLDNFVFRYLAARLNRSASPYLIGYKPDSHGRMNGLSSHAELIGLWVHQNQVNNGGDLTRFYMLVQNVRHVLAGNIPGDIVELGVYRGNSAAILARLAREHGRHLYLFDTFTGFDTRDLRGIDTGRNRDFSDVGANAVAEFVGAASVSLIVGYFPESTAGVELPKQLAVVHIDCDLHEPMKAGLEVFYPLVSSGGILILHDYSSGEWPGATRAIDEFFAGRPEKPVLIPDKSGTAVIRKI